MIFGTLFWILTVLTVSLVLLLLYVVNENREEVAMLITVLLICTGLFGWLILGNEITLTTQTRTIVAKVAINEDSGFVTYEGKLLFEIKAIPDFEYVKNRKEVLVKITRSINMYGRESDPPKYEILKVEK